MVEAIREFRPFWPGGAVAKHALEWCAGAGFIGFAAKAHGLVKRVSFTEIDPRAVKCLHKTVRENRLKREVTVHLGNGLRRLPERTFDLVLGNPPSYYAPDADGVLEDQ